MRIKCDVCYKEQDDIWNFDLLDDRANVWVKIGYCNICANCYEKEIKNYKDFILVSYKWAEDITDQKGLCNYIHCCGRDYWVVFSHVNEFVFSHYIDNPSAYKKHELIKNLKWKFYSRR